MKKILLLLTLLFLTVSLYAEVKFNDPRLLRYPEARQWSKDADTNGESAYNIGVLYDDVIKDNDKAIEWYQKAYEMDDKGASGSSANNLGYIYADLKEYEKSKEWYKKGIIKNSPSANFGLGLLYKKDYKMGDMRGANSLGLLYQHDLDDNKNAEIWYKKAVEKNHKKAIGNLAKLYHKQNKNQLGAAYLIALINNGHTKQKVLTYLKTKWKLTDKELQEAYKVQLVLDIPKHYYDPELENKPLPKKKTGRR